MKSILQKMWKRPFIESELSFLRMQLIYNSPLAQQGSPRELLSATSTFSIMVNIMDTTWNLLIRMLSVFLCPSTTVLEWS